LGSLTSMKGRSYGGIVAEFCPLNFTAQKTNPTDFPMFEDVVNDSNCGRGSKNIVRVDLKETVQLAREFDGYIAKNSDRISSHAPTILDLKGVVFHESQCGSSLATNLMMSLDPVKHRVYSQSELTKSAMKICDEGFTKCSVKAAGNLMKDIIYIMSRSNDPREENLFYTFHPESTRTMETFRAAFPTTPWIFLYREPIEAMVSQGKKPSFSMDPSRMVKAFFEKGGYNLDQITTREMLAAQLATFCLSAMRNFKDADGLGLAVKYSSDIVDDFIDTIFPKHFHTPVGRDGIKLILKASNEHSKSKDGLDPIPPKEERGNVYVSKSFRDAASDFLEKPYKMLEKSGYNVRNCRIFKPGGGVYLHCDGLIKEKDE